MSALAKTLAQIHMCSHSYDSLGFLEAYEACQARSEMETLAAVPLAINHMSLDALFERPVQAELIALLLLQRSDRRFTSCVLVHGMGGTGKTVTAVAAVREHAVRAFFREIHWLTVGADAIGERIKQLAAMLVSVLPRHRRIRSRSS